MNELKKIAYNCRKATFLIEKKQIGTITLREKLELKIHLAGCSICKTFQKQSIIINSMVKNLFNSSDNSVLKLDEQFKKTLHERIEKYFKNN
ncbi:hypothetical protein ADIARSV_0406 [Arcticibacter svalbardensis MN12-7]|uniref:Zinc-finger domain-containing protein n=1 Tax=Arcticibacter svalbardensis MN12-7 TaxID=1150600 RepID=R9GXB7_9SPHI|nr:hypothetical protein [Arcticibacter svalbardensis]EOR96406.1 hypothetical protein ADIARSV_0406 [Arcticibacter svalbardensis MN12-7]